MQRVIEHVIPDGINAIIGHSEDAGQCSYAIIKVAGTGLTSDYPSIRPDGSLAHWDEPDYWQHKTERKRMTVRVAVSGNAVCAESFIKKAGYEAIAISPCTVDIYVNNLINLCGKVKGGEK